MGCFQSKVPPNITNKSLQITLSGGNQKFSRTISLDRSRNLSIGGFNINYAYFSQKGFYPDSPGKANQDSFICIENFTGNSSHALFSVFDGHGQEGDHCAIFARDQFPSNLAIQLENSQDSINQALENAFVVTNEALHKSPIDDSLSGTTAISVLLIENVMYVANVGDSRAIVISKEGNKYVAHSLSSDQTPYRKDERERVKKCGARVMTMDQLEGIAPIHEDWDDLLGDEIDEGGDPPRIWALDGDYPGTAFSRSLGDHVAEELGVIAIPEILTRPVQINDAFVVIASDGVFEFLTNQQVADIIALYDDPVQACAAVVNQAYNSWLQYEVRTDDITVICLYLSDFTPNYSINTLTASGSSQQNLNLQPNKPVRRVGQRSIVCSQRGGDIGLLNRLTIDDTGKDQEGKVEDEEIDISQFLTPKTNSETEIILQAIQNNSLFQHLNDDQIHLIVQAMKPMIVSPSDIIIRQGDEGDKFYIVESGRFIVKVTQNDIEARNAEGKIVHTYQTNGNFYPFFGELALIHSQPRAASVIAATKGKLWALERTIFRKLLIRTSRTEIIQTLRKVSILKSLRLMQLQRLCDVLSEVTFKQGEKIIVEGETGNNFFIIQSGKVRVSHGNTLIGELTKNDFFGEAALMNNKPREATVEAIEPTVCLSLKRDVFEEVLSSLEEIKVVVQKRKNKALANTNLNQLSKKVVSFQNDLGNFTLCSYKGGHTTLRSFYKKKIVEIKQQADMLISLELHRSVSNFVSQDCNIAQIVAIIQDFDHLYFLLNGHFAFPLEYYLQQRENVLEETEAQHVTFCILRALEVLHSQNIAYRGIVPDLIHISVDGHAFLNDFRSAKLESMDSIELCGYFEYLAPEQIRGELNGAPVDIWQLGVLLYDMLMGRTPFLIAHEEVNEVMICEKILSFNPEAIEFSGNSNAFNLIKNLMQPEPQRRLGGDGNLKHILTHEFINVPNNHRPSNKSPLLPHVKKLMEQVTKSSIQPIVHSYDGDQAWCANW